MSFFRRESFPKRKGQPKRPQPKWHRLDHITDGRTFVALCGYMHRFSAIEDPLIRVSVKTKAIRCEKCDKKWEQDASEETD